MSKDKLCEKPNPIIPEQLCELVPGHDKDPLTGTHHVYTDKRGKKPETYTWSTKAGENR